ncbi:SusC/RagA family TonB-linked outer membrane protein [Proteiniphilum sp.]|uniref:SusC/RagA family TonB-linked outer membrane protein n=1 Tax=Proteiniphilum sp. TaxID=1926877 RepID=UPI002B21C248|nr:SusC/RagA family TonB-linked outer membrane protein [Proteiniphilum sp.]MEA4917817.1 SusC/RagA family TonB-linked outer membrane protein [Proteiniphilum sp.]
MNNSIKRSLLVFACMLLWAFSVNAQVIGTVKNEQGHTMQGVLVTSENGKDVTISDHKGNWNIAITDESTFLTFSFPGYVSYNLKVNEIYDETQDVILTRAETFDLDEKVFLGNYTQRKGEVTGSISRVTGKELERSPVGNLSMSLAGRLPGLLTRETYSEPARTNTELWVRGYSSPNGGTAMIVIDGFPYDYNANQLFEYITANEVESINILKDASAQALYGIQSANGVIVITTKRGIKQPIKIDVTVNHTFEQRTTTPPFINSADFVQLRNQAGFNDDPNSKPYFSKEAVEGFLSGENTDRFPNNNWRAMNAKDITQMSRVNVNLTGGNDRAVFYTNVNVLHQDGMWKVDPALTQYNPNNQFIWANIRSNVDVKLSKYFSFGLNLSGNIKRERTPGGHSVEVSHGGSWDGFANRIWYRFFTLPPYVYGPTTPLVQDPETGEITGGEVVVTETEPITSWALINRLGFDQYTVTNIYAQFLPKLDLDFIMPGLSISGSYGYQTNAVKGLFTNRTYEQWIRTQDYEALEFQKYSTQVNTPLIQRGTASFYYNLNYKGLLNYQRRFNGVHDINAMAYSFYQELNKSGGGLPYKRSNSGIGISYGYDDRYLVRADLGYSGSEQYSRQNRFTAFPAISAGWVPTNEAFLKDNPVLTFLKFRASWGKTGNDRGVGRYVYLDNVTLTGGGFGFLGGHNVNEGQVANPFLDPEIITKKNYGIDLTLLNNFSLSFDLYRERTENGVTSATSKTPEYQGVPLGNYPRTNVGIFENKGYEVSLGFNKDVTRDLNINLGGWLAHNKNKVIFWDESQRAGDFAYPIRQEGYPVGQEWGYIVDKSNGNGYFNSQEEIDNSGLVYEIGTPSPGYLKYYDLNADGKINDKDRAPLGHGALPHFFYAFNGGFKYKNFDMSVLFQGISDYWKIDQTLGRTEYSFEGVYTEWHKSAWTAERYANGEEIKYPALSAKKNSNHEPSNFFLEDKSYLRLKNLEIGYTFDLFKGMRLYFSGQNLFTWDKLKHDVYGPEGHFSGGIEGIPVYRLYNVGLSINF